jgi:hypothetical protein
MTCLPDWIHLGRRLALLVALAASLAGCPLANSPGSNRPPKAQ